MVLVRKTYSTHSFQTNFWDISIYQIPNYPTYLTKSRFFVQKRVWIFFRNRFSYYSWSYKKSLQRDETLNNVNIECKACYVLTVSEYLCTALTQFCVPLSSDEFLDIAFGEVLDHIISFDIHYLFSKNIQRKQS